MFPAPTLPTIDTCEWHHMCRNAGGVVREPWSVYRTTRCMCVYTMKACIHVDTTSADHAALFVSLRLSVRYTQVNQRHPGEIADLCSVPCSRTKTRTRQPGNTARRIHTLITATWAIFILWKGRHLKWRVIIYSAFYRYGDPINSVKRTHDITNIAIAGQLASDTRVPNLVHATRNLNFFFYKFQRTLYDISQIWAP